MTADEKKYEIREVILDGNQNYITANVINPTKTKSLYFIRDTRQSKNPTRFSNLEIAKVTAQQLVKKNHKLEYMIHFEDKEIDIFDTQRIGDHYQYYDKENRIKYLIKETKIHKLTKVGYFCFDDGANNRCDRSYGIKRNKELYQWMNDIINSYIYNNHEGGILRKEKLADNEMLLYVKGTSSRIHLSSCPRIMDFNQHRKEIQKHCIPFNRDVDKYLCFHIYATRDVQERTYLGADKKVDNIISDLESILYYNLPDNEKDSFEWLNVEFSGFIKIDDVR